MRSPSDNVATPHRSLHLGSKLVLLDGYAFALGAGPPTVGQETEAWTGDRAWILTFRLRQYWQGSIWIIPVGCAALGVSARDRHGGVRRVGRDGRRLIYSEGTAVGLLAAIFAGTISFTGFVFTMFLLLPQFGGSQLSARVLYVVYRDPRLKLIIGVFIGTMMYVFVVMGRCATASFPDVSLWVAGVLIFASVMFFLAFVSCFLQPSDPRPRRRASPAWGMPSSPRSIRFRYDERADRLPLRSSCRPAHRRSRCGTPVRAE